MTVHSRLHKARSPPDRTPSRDTQIALVNHWVPAEGSPVTLPPW
ncbi:hypothetical protein V2I01_40485 [Micromonospora sp. BRA006-A]|nr:hypothetical protein [Micromonospora sp. BRA006-A]